MRTTSSISVPTRFGVALIGLLVCGCGAASPAPTETQNQSASGTPQSTEPATTPSATDTTSNVAPPTATDSSAAPQPEDGTPCSVPDGTVGTLAYRGGDRECSCEREGDSTHGHWQCHAAQNMIFGGGAVGH